MSEDQCCGDPRCDGAACRRGERVLTLDEARAQVARANAASLRRTISEVLGMPSDTDAARQNKELVVRAAKELHDSVLAHARRFERPRVLRPDRRVRVVRT